MIRFKLKELISNEEFRTGKRCGTKVTLTFLPANPDNT